MKEYVPMILDTEKLCEKAKLLPHLPGIYMYFDKYGKIIYVGKAKDLKNRVLSYFRNTASHTPKTLKLLRSAVDFETIITKSESEALILENEKIKLHQPKYNIKLKDDRNYPYIKLSSGDYPALSFVRRKSDAKGDKSLYFGPYGTSSGVWGIINTANKLFRLPTCKHSFPKDIGKVKPCLYHHLDRCCGICTGNVSKEEYAKTVERVISFLKNDYRNVIKELTSEMNDSAERLDFERAAKLRDEIKSLNSLISDKQIVKDLSFSADAFSVWSDEVGGACNMLIVRDGRIIDSINYHFGADEIVSGDSFSSVLTEIYRSRSDYPPKIFLPKFLDFEEKEAVEKYISDRSGKKTEICIAERGNAKKITSLAFDNAREATLHKRRIEEKDERCLVTLSNLLCLEVFPENIESIDISNSGNDCITASVISIKNARFSKKDYKTFNIRLDKQNDFASMYEAISRRVQRFNNGDKAFSPLPDLILVDGGKGQVSAVKKALSDNGAQIPVFGMVKNEYHKTAFLTDGENEISILKEQELFRFIYSIQEEVHRFTILRMNTRKKASVSSSRLTEISGIGKSKASALLRYFKSIKNIKNAALEDLVKVKGISEKNARDIITYFQK